MRGRAAAFCKQIFDTAKLSEESLDAARRSRMSVAIRPILLANVEKGNLTSLKALLDGRTRGAALTALLDARLEAAKGFTLLA